jgi:DNA polymerase-3 subunit epsilon/CBS domain-containing protein
MPAGNTGAMPLIGLDAIVLDSETTGLDPKKANIVELAAVRLVGGKLDTGAPFRSLVRPPQPIPPTSTAIHRIDDAAVATAPGFAAVWPALAAFTGDSVVIGHAVGFDLAVLKRECEAAGIVWRRPRSLCTGLLAQVAAPDLAGYSLEQLAAWLGLAGFAGRHSALGDATMTARIFLALVPHLRERGIRTLAEAEQASRGLGEALAGQHRAGWVEAVTAPAPESDLAAQRIDTYPFRHRVAAVMSAPVKGIAAEATVASALQRMTGEKVSSLLVFPVGGDPTDLRPDRTGIVTERDLMRAVAAQGPAVLNAALDTIARRPLHTIRADAFVYRAVSRMNRHGIRHLVVVDAEGRICGMVSARDLLRLRANEAIGLGDALESADDVATLARHWADLPRVAAALRAEGIAGLEIAAVISDELAALTRRAAVLAERRMQDAGHGAPPCPYALAVLGSAGRGESLLAMDQDNAIIFAEGGPDGAADRWFAQLGGIVADILHEVGVPYCKGGVMARNAQWRGSLATWRARVEGWIGRSNPADLLSVDIFFDLRAVYGATALGETLWRDAFAMARGEVGFAKLLAEAAGTVAPGLTLFGRLRTEGGRIDLKMAGLFGIVTTARVLAIRHHVVERATPERLKGIGALGIGSDADLGALIDAQGTFLDLILAQQIDDIAHGLPPSNRVAARPLSRRDRARLHTALAAVRHLDELTRALLFRG